MVLMFKRFFLNDIVIHILTYVWSHIRDNIISWSVSFFFYDKDTFIVYVLQDAL